MKLILKLQMSSRLFQGDTSVVFLIVLCFGVEFLCCLSLIVNTPGARLAYMLMCVSYFPRFLCVETSFTVLPLGPKRNRWAACASKQSFFATE